MLIDSQGEAYESAVHPRTSSVTQNPVRVAVISKQEDIREALVQVGDLALEWERPLRSVPQATGHGAGGVVDDDVVLFDTSRLTSVRIDPDRRVAVVGAGTSWAQVNDAAERFGLMGLAGSAPSVSVSGYTFAGGIGWLVRRDGMASGALRSVGYFDADGTSRLAEDGAADSVDREAIWAFRGAGGVGIAHTLEFDLFPVPDLHAGALLWSADALDDLLDAWSGAIAQVGPTVSSSIGVLHLPSAPIFPEPLRGATAVHLAVADPEGPDGARPLLEALRAVAAPITDGWGPADAAALARIHLDPPVATPAVGTARWLNASTPTVAPSMMRAAGSEKASLAMAEIRHVAGAPTRRPGAVTTPPGAFIAHAVGSLDRFDRDEIEASFATVRAAWKPADAGSTPGSWVEGAAHVRDALDPAVLARARAVADAVDPHHLIGRSRLLT